MTDLQIVALEILKNGNVKKHGADLLALNEDAQVNMIIDAAKFAQRFLAFTNEVEFSSEDE